MDTYRLLNTIMGATALLLILVHMGRVALAALRRRRSGAPPAMVGAGATTQLIGIGLAVASASAAGYLAFVALQPTGMQPFRHLLTQVLTAAIASWLVGRAYSAWLARPVFNWFAGEEGARHDR